MDSLKNQRIYQAGAIWVFCLAMLTAFCHVACTGSLYPEDAGHAETEADPAFDRTRDSPIFLEDSPTEESLAFEQTPEEAPIHRVYFSTGEVGFQNAPDNPYQLLILENNQLRIECLPGLGGRVFRLKNKNSGTEQLYQNTIYRPVGNWGLNACNNGDWIGIGGIEIAFPEQEHGCVYNLPFDHDVLGNEHTGWTIRMWKEPDVELTYGMKLTVEVTLRPNQAFFELKAVIENPIDNPLDKPFQFWTNAMASPERSDPRDADLEFIFPLVTTQVVVHSTGIWELTQQCQTEYCNNDQLSISWPQAYGLDWARYHNWKDKGWLGLFSPSHHYQASFSHTEREALVRVKKTNIHGFKLFGLGNISTDHYTDNGKQYVELWAGLTQDFWSYKSLAKGSQITYEEYWLPMVFEDQPSDPRSAIEATIGKLIP